MRWTLSSNARKSPDQKIVKAETIIVKRLVGKDGERCFWNRARRLTGGAIAGTPVATPEGKAHLRRVSPATIERVECVANLRLQGIAAARGELARTHMVPDLALIVLDSLGLTIADPQAAGADAHDLEAIKPTKAAA
jgi:hypothetical protein